MYKKLGYFFLSLIMSSQVLANNSLDDFKLTILTENYPPLNMSIADKNFARSAEIDGISTDIVREMMTRANVDYTLTLRFPWSKIYKLGKNSKNFAVFSMARLPEREQDFKWVGPLVEMRYDVFSLTKNKISIKNFNDLKKYKVSSVKGHAVTKILASKGIKTKVSLKEDTIARKLNKGQIDLWATGEFSGFYYAQKERISPIKPVYTVSKVDEYLALNPSVPDSVVTRLQAALEGMKQDGTVETIISSYR